MAKEKQSAIAMMPIHLGAPEKNGEVRGAKIIATMFGVHPDTVSQWKKEGAPIVEIGGYLQAEYNRLWDWLLKSK